MKPIVWFIGCLFLQVFLCGGSGVQSPVPPSQDGRSVRTPSGPEEAIRLVERIWALGFFQNCDSVRDEFLDNDYAFFDPKDPLASLEKREMACYSRGRGRKDTVYLREDIFAHFKVGLEGVFERGSVDPTALKVLVHELCHDLWSNLLEERERAYFATDGEDFIEGYRRAMNAKERRRFLLQAGQELQNADRSRFLEDLEILIATYPPDLLNGPELFAWLGEKAFSANVDIPPIFRKYFSGLITTAAPRRGELSS